jgi:hypothetical protein
VFQQILAGVDFGASENASITIADSKPSAVCVLFFEDIGFPNNSIEA